MFSSIFLQGWILVNEIGVLTRHKSDIEVHEAWNDDALQSVLKGARKSITIIDSYYDEANYLETCVQAILATQRRVKVSIYMASPEKPFGAQRDLERNTTLEKESYSARLWKGVTSADTQAYTSSFRQFCADLTQHVGRNGVALELFEYPTMLPMRLMMIDEATFIVGWFPLRAHNPAYLCFSVDDHRLRELDRMAIKCFRGQVEQVKAIGRPVNTASLAEAGTGEGKEEVLG